MKILIVDDEKIARDSLKALLSACNFDVEVAADGPAAIRTAATFLPDVAIVDRCLGQSMDGLELAHALRELSTAIKIIVVSGLSEIDSGEELAYDFLRKPFRLEELQVLLKPGSRHTPPLRSPDIL